MSDATPTEKSVPSGLVGQPFVAPWIVEERDEIGNSNCAIGQVQAEMEERRVVVIAGRKAGFLSDHAARNSQIAV